MTSWQKNTLCKLTDWSIRRHPTPRGARITAHLCRPSRNERLIHSNHSATKHFIFSKTAIRDGEATYMTLISQMVYEARKSVLPTGVIRSHRQQNFYASHDHNISQPNVIRRHHMFCVNQDIQGHDVRVPWCACTTLEWAACDSSESSAASYATGTVAPWQHWTLTTLEIAHHSYNSAQNK